jgi:predicted anti-sigma-YlaC factor YlaD
MALTEAQRREWDERTRLLRNYTNQEAPSTQLHLAVADHLAACERVLGLFQKAAQLFNKHSEMMCAFTALGTVDHERLVALSHEAHEAEQEAYDALAEWMEGDDGE